MLVSTNQNVAFQIEMIASICMGHSAYKFLYQMNKSMEASEVNNKDTFVVSAAVPYINIVLLVMKTFQIIVGQHF